jgi:anaerobic selenocysteine-containing dehydrogenase
MHVVVTEKLYDAAFVGSHTTGFEELSTHVRPFTPAWGATETDLEANQIMGVCVHATGHDLLGGDASSVGE